MILYVVDSVLEVPIPLREVHLEQVLQEVFQLGGKVRGKPDLGKNWQINILIEEWWYGCTIWGKYIYRTPLVLYKFIILC